MSYVGKYEQFEVEQTYLLKPKDGDDPDGFTFIRRRGQNGSYHYTYSMLRDVPGDVQKNQKTILERQISGREYVALQQVQNIKIT